MYLCNVIIGGMKTKSMKKRKKIKQKWRIDISGFNKEIKQVVDVTFGQN